MAGRGDSRCEDGVEGDGAGDDVGVEDCVRQRLVLGVGGVRKVCRHFECLIDSYDKVRMTRRR